MAVSRLSQGLSHSKKQIWSVLSHRLRVLPYVQEVNPVSIEVLRFIPYSGSRGNAIAFADVAVKENGRVYIFKDVKLFRYGSAGLRISPKQEKTPDGWAFAYLIPARFQEKIRQALIERWRTEQSGQLILL